MRSTETKLNTLEDLLQGHVRCMPWWRETSNRLNRVCKLCFILSQVTCSFSVNTWAKEANINFDPPCLLLSCFFPFFSLRQVYIILQVPPHPKQCSSSCHAQWKWHHVLKLSGFINRNAEVKLECQLNFKCLPCPPRSPEEQTFSETSQITRLGDHKPREGCSEMAFWHLKELDHPAQLLYLQIEATDKNKLKGTKASAKLEQKPSSLDSPCFSQHTWLWRWSATSFQSRKQARREKS